MLQAANAKEAIANIPPAGRQPRLQSILPRIAFAVDLALIAVALLIGVIGRTHLPWLNRATDVASFAWPVSGFFAGAWLFVLLLSGAYSRRRMGSGTEEYRTILRGSLLAAGLLGASLFVTQYPLSRGFFALTFLVGLPLLILGRFVLRRVVHRLHESGRLLMRAVVVGRSHPVDEVVRVLQRERWLGYDVIGSVAPPGAPDTPSRTNTPSLGTIDRLPSVVAAERIDTVILSANAIPSAADFRRLAWELEDQDVQLVVVPGMTDISANRVHARPVAGLPLMYVERPQAAAAGAGFKRTFDCTLAVFALVLTAPLMAITALAIKVDSKGPVLFRQTRVGRDGELFTCFKLRSMVHDAEERRAALESDTAGVLFKQRRDPRVTKVGSFIRRYSIDEIPQLLNVLQGHMSLIGPRPPLPHEVAQYEKHVHRRLRVRPGMTGLWQVSGRSDLSWEDTVRLDLYYVDNWSLVQDLAILARTFRAVASSDGAY